MVTSRRFWQRICPLFYCSAIAASFWSAPCFLTYNHKVQAIPMWQLNVPTLLPLTMPPLCLPLLSLSGGLVKPDAVAADAAAGHEPPQQHQQQPPRRRSGSSSGANQFQPQQQQLPQSQQSTHQQQQLGQVSLEPLARLGEGAAQQAPGLQPPASHAAASGHPTPGHHAQQQHAGQQQSCAGDDGGQAPQNDVLQLVALLQELLGLSTASPKQPLSKAMGLLVVRLPVDWACLHVFSASGRVVMQVRDGQVLHGTGSLPDRACMEMSTWLWAHHGCGLQGRLPAASCAGGCKCFWQRGVLQSCAACEAPAVDH